MSSASGTTIETGAADDAERSVRELSPESEKSRSTVIPTEVARRYLQQGNQLHFPDRALAIEDRGNRLIASTDNRQVASDLALIAKARGWTGLEVRGSEAFKAHVSREASAQGLWVKGYESRESTKRQTDSASSTSEPSPADPSFAYRAEALRDPENRATQPTRRPFRQPAPAPLRPGEIAFGQLIDHGEAPYRRNEDATRSYFVRIRTDAGEREFWGTDLKRAVRQTNTHLQPGDEIGVQFRGRRGSYASSEREAASPLARRQQNVWHVEHREFFEARRDQAQALRGANEAAVITAAYRSPQDRSLVQVATLEQLARVFAEERIAEEADRRRFTDAVRRTLAETLENGQALPEIRLRHTPRTQKSRQTSLRESKEVSRGIAPDDPVLTR